MENLNVLSVQYTERRNNRATVVYSDSSTVVITGQTAAQIIRRVSRQGWLLCYPSNSNVVIAYPPKLIYD